MMSLFQVPFFEWQHKTEREREFYLTHKVTSALNKATTN